MTSRKKLYELVWASPMIKVAEQFGVSATYLSRVCRALNVPHPKRGYWAKLAVGRAPEREKLPPARLGDQLVWHKGEALFQPPRPKALPGLRQGRQEARSTVPRSQIHPLIHGARAHFLNTRTIDKGAYLKPFKRLLVDLHVSAACLDRALDIANDLFNRLEAAGHRVVFASTGERWSRPPIDERENIKRERTPNYDSGLQYRYRPTVVFMEELAIGLALIEMSEEVLMRYVGGRYIRDSEIPRSKLARYPDGRTWTTKKAIPSGRLRLVVFSPYGSVDWSKSWQERGSSSLSSMMPKIVDEIEKAIPSLRSRLAEAARQAEIRYEEWAAAEERRLRAEDKRKVEESIRDSRDHLRTIIGSWATVMSIEQFLTGVERRAESLQGEERSKVDERLRLARAFLGSQNPLEFFGNWKTPSERYQPVFSEIDDLE